MPVGSETPVSPGGSQKKPSVLGCARRFCWFYSFEELPAWEAKTDDPRILAFFFNTLLFMTVRPEERVFSRLGKEAHFSLAFISHKMKHRRWNITWPAPPTGSSITQLKRRLRRSAFVVRATQHRTRLHRVTDGDRNQMEALLPPQKRIHFEKTNHAFASIHFNWF